MSLAVYEANGNGHAALAERSTFDILSQAAELAAKIAPTEFVPAGLRNRPAAVMAAILTGHEIGLPPMASLSNIHVIEGKPTLSAQAMRALVLSQGHYIAFEEMSITRVTIVGRRRGESDPTKVTWTMDDARRAGLAEKQNWKKYPRPQLIARCTGELVRAIFADVIAGIPYTMEELEDGIAEESSQTDQAPLPKNRRRISRSEPPSEAPPSEPVAESAVPLASARTESINAASTKPEPPPEPDLSDDIPPSPEEVDTSPPPPPSPSSKSEPLTLAQQIAMVCREAGLNRATLLEAVTGKTSGKEITREQAVEVLNTARAIHRGESRFEYMDGAWQVLRVEEYQPALPTA